MNIYEFALSLFRPLVIKKSERLNTLSENLKKAQFTNATAEEYYALSILLSIIALPIAMIVALLFAVISGVTLKNMLLVSAISLSVSAGTGILVLYYPKAMADTRKKKIENSLSFATLYLTTMSESSILPKDMFKLLGGLTEYGAIAEEARRISEDIEAVGLDFPSAVERAIRRSPSVEWSEFLAGFRTTIVGGGELRSYLEEKTRGYTSEYKERLVSFGKMLTMILQMYLTVVGIGTVFFIVISSLMGVIGGVSTTMIKFMQYSIVLGGIPLMTIAMIILIRIISPLTVK